MAHGNIVVQSYNLEGNTVCVDIFMRTDGTYEDVCIMAFLGLHDLIRRIFQSAAI